ncbi:MAG: GGDEF domain-containing protein [Clostridiales Family XIII bacterium]|nr:GGDEF domain-containing protein [Clostridiales Family XIII bacterium]
MKKIQKRKEYVIIFVCIALFLGVSLLSFTSIKQLQGNARVVNYDGIVRGATQKLMKEELMNAYNKDGGVNYSDDALIARLDSIINELKYGDPLPGADDNDLIVLNDEKHRNYIDQIIVKWNELKAEIYNVRDGADPHKLFDLSQEYFVLVNDTVFAAEAFSERQVNRTTTLLIGINLVIILFILIAVFLFLRSAASTRRAEALGLIAYVDPLTKMENRASCERKINGLKASPPPENIAVIMFDMNNLKLTNDFLGHQGGDRLIAKFAEALQSAAEKVGFVGRYGGDEFLAIFENADEKMVQSYLNAVQKQSGSYNSLQVNDIEKISYAAGYVIANLQDTGIDDMIYEADREMYANKRTMKKRNS